MIPTCARMWSASRWKAVRLLSNLGSGNAPDSAYVLAAYDQLTTAAYLLHQIIPWTKEEKQ